MSKYHEIEAREQKPMPDILIELFDQFGQAAKPQAVVAEKLGVSQPTLSQWIKFCRLQRKTVLIPPIKRRGGESQPS